MRVCMISEVYPPRVGGVGEVVYHLARYLREEENVDVDVVTTNSNNEDNVIGLGKSLYDFFLRSSFAFNDLINTKDYDLIHVHNYSGTGLLPYYLGQKDSLPPIIATFHVSSLQEAKEIAPVKIDDNVIKPRLGEYIFKYFKSPPKILFELLSAKMASHIVCVSKATKRTCIRDYGLSEKKVDVVYNGVDLERFHPDNDGSFVREKHGLGDRPVILNIGVFRVRKRPHLLLYAMKKVVKEHEDAVLVVVGGGRGYEQELVRLRSRLGLEKNVIFTGRVPEEEVPLYYAASDFVVVPSSYEPFGLTVIESMASGKPVIGSKVGGISESIDHGKNGFHFSKDNSNQLEACILELLNTPRQCERMGINAREKTVEKYDWKIICANYQKIYKKIV